jgi:hypothetical protein
MVGLKKVLNPKGRSLALIEYQKTKNTKRSFSSLTPGSVLDGVYLQILVDSLP